MWILLWLPLCFSLQLLLETQAACELDASGAPGKAPYWKFVDLFVYSVGPFLATFLVNIAIIVGISRKLRRGGNKFASPPRVRFLTVPSCRSVRARGAVADEEAEVDDGAAVVEFPARESPGNEEIREALVAQQSARSTQLLIKDEAISKRVRSRSQTRTILHKFTALKNIHLSCKYEL